MRKGVLKIEENQRKKSNQDIYDAVNQGRIQPPAYPIENPLDDLDQFESSSPEIPAPMTRAPVARMSDDMNIPEPPSYNIPSYPS